MDVLLQEKSLVYKHYVCCNTEGLYSDKGWSIRYTMIIKTREIRNNLEKKIYDFFNFLLFSFHKPPN